MAKNKQYSQQFQYALDMLKKIERYPMLAEQMTQGVIFKDFLNVLKMCEEDIESNDA